MDGPQQLNKLPAGLPLHPKKVKINKLLSNQVANNGFENPSIHDTISSQDSRQYSYNSPQLNFQISNKLNSLASQNQNLPQKLGSGSKDARLYMQNLDSPANTAYFRESSIQQSYDDENFNKYRNPHITPNSLDYSASPGFNTQNLKFNALQSQNFQNLGNITNKHNILQKAYPYQYDQNQFETLGQSPNLGKRFGKDQELESTVFGQSSIQATFQENTSRLSDDQTYFGNMKSHPNVTNSFSGTGFKPNYGSNFNTISSSAESTPHKDFINNMMLKKQLLGYQTGTNQSQELDEMYEGGLSKFSHRMNMPDARINNNMDDDKASFNPMNTHDAYDLSKYTGANSGDEIYIDHNVQPIAEQSDEESRFEKTGNTTPISSEPRGGYRISSSTTPQNYTTNRDFDRSENYPPNANFDDSQYNSRFISMPKYGEKTYYQNSSNAENTFDDKTTDLTGNKSYLDKNLSGYSKTIKNSSTPEVYSRDDDSSLIGSHLYNKHQMHNLQLSQLSASNGAYDGTNSKLLSSPTIEERGADSEEASQNDSRLKMSQLDSSPRKTEENRNFNFDEFSQPRTGTIGETTARLGASSTLAFISNIDNTSSFNDHKSKNVTDFEEYDYKSYFKKFADKKYDKNIELDEIKPSSIFKNRSYQRNNSRFNYVNKRIDEDYEQLKKLKLISLYGSDMQKDVDQVCENLKTQKST